MTKMSLSLILFSIFAITSARFTIVNEADEMSFSNEAKTYGNQEGTTFEASLNLIIGKKIEDGNSEDGNSEDGNSEDDNSEDGNSKVDKKLEEQIQTLKTELKKNEAALHASNYKITEAEESINRMRLYACGLLQMPSSIPNEQITASSYWGSQEKLSAPYGRLFSTSGFGAWISDGRQAQWIQVDLAQNITIYGVATQGRNTDDEQWVKSYRVSTQTDGGNFRNVENKSGAYLVFQGNTDQNTPVMNLFPQSILARYFRIHPITVEGGDFIALRFDVIRC